MRPARLKPFLGILILVLAAAGMYFWETQGRARLLTAEAVTVRCEVAAGEVITEGMLETTAYFRENIAGGAFLPGEEALAVGQLARVDLHSGMQLNRACLRTPKESGADESCFAISSLDMAHFSQSLRAGDTVELLTEDAAVTLGRYKVAYVRDDKGRPITELDGRQGSDFLRRGESTGEIAEIEIITNVMEYRRILEYINSPARLVVVQVSEDKGGEEI